MRIYIYINTRYILNVHHFNNINVPSGHIAYLKGVDLECPHLDASGSKPPFESPRQDPQPLEYRMQNTRPTCQYGSGKKSWTDDLIR